MIGIKNVSFRYGEGDGPNQLDDISLNIEEGEVVLIAGTSGSGKSTLTRIINGLIPHYFEGTMEGSAEVAGKDVAKTPLYDMAELCGSLFQNPRSQFFCVDTTSELAFACENMGMEESEIARRINETAEELKVENLLGRSIFRLSGGEKQKIAAASISTLSPPVLVLDEPTSNLDAESILVLRSVIEEWKKKGKTVVVAEHRLSFMKGLADRVIYIDRGKIAEEWTASEFFSEESEFFRERGLRTGEVSASREPLPPTGEKIEIRNMVYSWKKGERVLNIPSLSLEKGRITAVIGENGAGKTTFARSLCGLLKKDASTVIFDGKEWKRKKRMNLCYLVMQDVNHQLFTEDVLDEVLLSMKDEDEEKALAILSTLGLAGKKDLHPMSLSGGEKQRVAIASAIASERSIIVFDEPTSGLDLGHMMEVAESMRMLRAKGLTLLVVTHDPELISETADDVLLLEKGEVRGLWPMDGEGRAKTAAFFRGDEDELHQRP